MLRAITSGKAGRLSGVSEALNWRKAFQMSEDLLTASVFGRLAYLDGAAFWRILCRTFTGLTDYKVAELNDIQFWPRWEESRGTGSIVEPDLFLEFNVGDPQITIRLIVEAKFGFNPQYADQWGRQWAAYQQKNEEGSEDGSKVYLAAIGGMRGNVQGYAENLKNEINTRGPKIEVVAADWDHLLRALEAERANITDRAKLRIIDDIIAALALGGHQHLRLMEGMPMRRWPWNEPANRMLKHFKMASI